MSTIGDRIRSLHEELHEGVHLCAVSKFHPAEAVREAYDAGQRIFGESRVQELEAKIPELPSDILWHFIGHLQTNKVKKLISLRPAMIESVDSWRLLAAIDKEAEATGFVARVLLEVHVAEEETKTGFSHEEVLEYFGRQGFNDLKATHICGIMGMATNTDDEARIRSDFHRIADTFLAIRTLCGDSLIGFDTLSMGMSGDWRLAVDEGSNLVRIGSAIFGLRNY